MIVSEVMATQLITVTPNDSLSHAASLLRQYQFHHLPVVRPIHRHETSHSWPVLEGLITSYDIDLAASVEAKNSSNLEQQPWEERRVAEVMNRSIMRVTPTTSVAAAAQILVKRGLNCLPVVEYEESVNAEQGSETRPLLVGLLTRSDLLLELARTLGAFEPGMDILLPLPMDDLTSLAKLLQLAATLHTKVHSVIVAPPKKDVPHVARVRIGTMNPASLLVALQKAGISYSFAYLQPQEDFHA
jgi:acetoin utilization protein AcuB